MIRVFDPHSRSIARRGWERKYIEGKVLCEQGKRGDEFFVILQGRCEVVRNGRKVRTLGPGDHFGEVALLHPSIKGIPRTATVTATSPLRCFVLNKLDLWVLIDDRDIAVTMLRSLAERLADLAGEDSP